MELLEKYDEVINKYEDIKYHLYEVVASLEKTDKLIEDFDKIEPPECMSIESKMCYFLLDKSFFNWVNLATGGDIRRQVLLHVYSDGEYIYGSDGRLLHAVKMNIPAGFYDRNKEPIGDDHINSLTFPKVRENMIEGEYSEPMNWMFKKIEGGKVLIDLTNEDRTIKFDLRLFCKLTALNGLDFKLSHDNDFVYKFSFDNGCMAFLTRICES